MSSGPLPQDAGAPGSDRPQRPGPALPPPEPEALAHSERLRALIVQQIAAAGGWIRFAQFMALSLYAPGLGYYSAGSRKLGRDGDFTTAPEMTPLFGHALAAQVAQALAARLPAVLEVGAGTGSLAASILERLESLDALPRRYQILELSADLRERCRDTLAARVPHLLGRVEWINGLPPGFEGVVIANEVLDAMPVELVQWQEGGQIAQGGVCVGADGRLALAFRPVRDPALRARAAALPVAAPYQSEIGDAAAAFVRTLAGHVARGACFFIDYGFARREFYHPERAQGTLMCHYRHRAHTDPLLWPGLQDITAHVDFSAIAEAAREGGMTVSGYCSQANFLINCGITGELARLDPAQAARYLPAANAVQRLLSPAEMGELFKVIGLSRGIDFEPVGFARGNRAGSL